MLLTIPWVGACWAGRVNIVDENMPDFKRMIGWPLYQKRFMLTDSKTGEVDIKTTPFPGAPATKLFPPGKSWPLGSVGVEISDVQMSTQIMFASALGYLVIQIPGFYSWCGSTIDVSDKICDKTLEDSFALYGMIYCCVAFIGYLAYMTWAAGHESHVEGRTHRAIEKYIKQAAKNPASAQAGSTPAVSFWAAMKQEAILVKAEEASEGKRVKEEKRRKLGCLARFPKSTPAGESAALKHKDGAEKTAGYRILRNYFNRYDLDHTNCINQTELSYLIQDLMGNYGVTMTGGEDKKVQSAFEAIMDKADSDDDKNLSFDEFRKAIPLLLVGDDQYDVATLLERQGVNLNLDADVMAQNAVAIGDMADKEQTLRLKRVNSDISSPLSTNKENAEKAKLRRELQEAEMTKRVQSAVGSGEKEEEEGEEEEVPEAIAKQNLTPEQQACAIKLLALRRMTIGTVLVVIFSDPMVGVLSELGQRTPIIGLPTIPAFYVSFVLAPIASNASELVAAISYGAKKTRSSIKVSIEQCLGAAIMNNTFCLGIFLAIIWGKSLIWEFSAETISIVLIEILVGMVSFKKVHSGWMYALVLSFYPLCVGVVAFLESPIVGMN